MFQQWGLPEAIRSDNGEPFGVPTRDVVPIMSLWLLAWGITPILNRPRTPQDNAKVESNQGTTSRWAEVKECSDVHLMQQRLDEAAFLQRQVYPVKRLGKMPRSEVFQELNTIRRPFEPTLFDEHRAYAYLAQAIYPRKVSSIGATTIYNKRFQVGLPHKGKIVFLKFEPHSISWHVFDQDGNLIKTIPDPRFSRDNLYNLTVCQ